MKITRKQLQKMIKQETWRLCEQEQNDIGFVDVIEIPPEAETPVAQISENASPEQQLMVEMELAARSLELVIESTQKAAALCAECEEGIAAYGSLVEASVTQAEALQETLEAQAAVLAEGIEDAVDYTGDLSDLSPTEAFGLGYTASEQGLT